MSVYHVIQVSDIHLSAERAYNQANWVACLRHIAHEQPHLVVVTGDLVLDDPDSTEDHKFARSQLNRIPVPWVATPGNHDIGDANPKPFMDQHINEERLQRYLSYFGADRWVRELGDWRLIGLNALLPGSGLDAEDEQYEWLRAVTRGDRSRRTALFLHKPLCVEHLAERSSADTCIIETGRQKLLSALSGVNLCLVASGHNHHYRTQVTAGVLMVWAPSTGMYQIFPRSFRAMLCPGVVHYWLDEDRLEYGLVVPNGLVPNDVTALCDRYTTMRFAPPMPIARGLDAEDVGYANMPAL